MSHAVCIPKLGLTMEEATIAEWHFADGDRVTKGQTLLTIETDKIMFDVEAEADGFLQKAAPLQARLQVGDVAGHLHEQPFTAAPPSLPATVAAADPVSPGPVSPPPQVQAHPASLVVQAQTGERRLASPLARRLAQERGLDLGRLRGSGPGGVILQRDIPEAAPLVAATPHPRDAAPAESSQRRTPMTAMRRAISRRMAHSLATTAQMTGFGRIDMGETVAWREALAAQAPALGVRITYTDILIKTCACLLGELPDMNAYIDGDDVVSPDGIHIGFAVSVEGGLLVPVVHDADRLSLVEVAKRRVALMDKARAGKLSSEEVGGGTFTVSNFGSYGGDFETPILNAPQSALLGLGRICDEAVVRDRQIVIRPMMWISLTFDHRLIDGALAGRFRARLRECLEQPTLLMAHLR